jgi:hypothetical protein
VFGKIRWPCCAYFLADLGEPSQGVPDASCLLVLCLKTSLKQLTDYFSFGFVVLASNKLNPLIKRQW